MKPRIKEVIVVEGRYDRNALAQVVDATVVETGGFSVFNNREKLAFLRRLAVMEVELQREDQGFTVPRGLRVLREVSGDWRLKNAALAGHVPPEEELLAEMEENGGFPCMRERSVVK